MAFSISFVWYLGYSHVGIGHKIKRKHVQPKNINSCCSSLLETGVPRILSFQINIFYHNVQYIDFVYIIGLDLLCCLGGNVFSTYDVLQLEQVKSLIGMEMGAGTLKRFDDQAKILNWMVNKVSNIVHIHITKLVLPFTDYFHIRP